MCFPAALATDPATEFVALTRHIWPRINNPYTRILRITSEAALETVPTATIGIGRSDEAVQVYESMFPLPEASGRACYVEFQLTHLSHVQPASYSIVAGVALAEIAGKALGRAKASAALDLTHSLLFDGLPAGKPLEPIELNVGDIIGIGMCFECHRDERSKDCLFVTKNGKLLIDSRTLPAAHRHQYLPTIACTGCFTSWSLNRGGKRRFLFDLAGWQSSHADHDVYRTYLGVDPLTTAPDDLSKFTWLEPKIAEYFAYAEHYLAIRRALASSKDKDFLFPVTSLQLKLLQLAQVKHYLFPPDVTTPWTLPPSCSTQASWTTFLQASGMEPFELNFDQDSDTMARHLQKHLTVLRADIQVRMMELVAERYSLRQSIFDDLEESRGGAMEGWIKFALFLNHNLHVPENPWTSFIREKVLDLLLEMGLSLDEVAAGFITAESATHDTEPDHDGANEQVDEALAERAISIGMSVVAWATYTGTLTKNLETELLALHGRPGPKIEAPIKDRSLYLLVVALMDDQHYWPLSMEWVLMQFEAFGFCHRFPQLNAIPKSFDEAVTAVQAYFGQLVAAFSEADFDMPLRDLQQLDAAGLSSDLEYLSHVCALATGKDLPSATVVRNLIASQIPLKLLQSRGLERVKTTDAHLLAPPALPFAAPQTMTQEIPPALPTDPPYAFPPPTAALPPPAQALPPALPPRSTDNMSPHPSRQTAQDNDGSSSTWPSEANTSISVGLALAGALAVGLASAAIGALVAISFVKRR